MADFKDMNTIATGRRLRAAIRVEAAVEELRSALNELNSRGCEETEDFRDDVQIMRALLWADKLIPIKHKDGDRFKLITGGGTLWQIAARHLESLIIRKE